jgi:hypothetical protein
MEAYVVIVGKPEGKRPYGRFDAAERILLKWISVKYSAVKWTALNSLRLQSSGCTL